MTTEPHKAAEPELGDARDLSCRDGKYWLRLRLPGLELPHEFLLHGVSHLADALTIASFFDRNPIHASLAGEGAF